MNHKNIDMKSLNNKGAHLWIEKPVINKNKLISWIIFNLKPKKFFFYNNIKNKRLKILDYGSGSGALTLELGYLKPKTKIIGIDVSDKLHNISIMQKENYKIKNVKFQLYNGLTIPYPNNFFDMVISCDVFGHVPNLQRTMDEINRVLKPRGKISIFSETKMGKIPIITRLYKKGIIIDKSKEYHISLFSKKKLNNMLLKAGFRKLKYMSPYYLRFFTHPKRYYFKLKKSKNKKIKTLIKLLYFIKSCFGIIGRIICNIYSIIEMYTIGKIVETQGIFITGIKEKSK